MGRPLSAKSSAVLWLIDAQLATERCLGAVRYKGWKEAERCLIVIRAAQRLAAGALDKAPIRAASQ